MYIIFTANRRVEKEISKLDTTIKTRIVRAIQELAMQPRPSRSTKLAGNMQGSWRIRVGPYRIIYDIDDKEQTVVILAVLHRREAYR